MSEFAETSNQASLKPEHVTNDASEKPKKEFVEPQVPEISTKSENKVDALMAFGQGRVKPLIQASELTDELKGVWGEFKKDPLHSSEPDFRVIEGEAWTKQLEGLSKEQQDAKIADWQTQGRFGLNRWGREIGLDVGLRLITGQSKVVLLSGGRTIPDWAKESLSKERLDKWPSEAELMADIVTRRFGSIYEEKFGKSIEEVLIIEDSSLNTLENVTNTINKYPDLLGPSKKVGLVGADFHQDRIKHIVEKLSPGTNVSDVFGAQQGLRERNEERQGWRKHIKKIAGRSTELELNERVEDARESEARTSSYREILDWMKDPENMDLKNRESGEARWTKGLSEPEFLGYWFGYIGYIEDPSIFQDSIKAFKDDSRWAEAARQVFEDANLDFDELAAKELSNMSNEDYEESIASKLRTLTRGEYRGHKMPPETSTAT